MKAYGTVHKYGDNVDTDVIIPARYLNSSDPAELAKHCMEDIDKEFVNNVKAGDIIVAKKNFGCGSSREHAPIAIKASGVSCVIADTFARIFYRNSINIGLPIIECPEVDNCYGEFVQDKEPTDYGADLIAGSLIKNPGGGLAPIGGYICGKKEYVENAAYRLTTPGLGKEVGASLNNTKAFAQGLFMAPSVTASALKGAIFAANVYENLGFKTVPNKTEDRFDIIQAVELQTPERVVAFCEGIQAAAPVDSYVKPVPWDMPGYDSPVIMAAGAFVSGSSIELSADAPMREPYAVYFQGGLTYQHAKFGIVMTLQKMVENNLIVW